MVLVHLIFDMTELFRVVNWEYSAGFTFLKNWGGVAFVLISGISAQLGRRSLRRGLTVLGCGLLVSAVTYLADPGLTVWFGVLHCLGLCMILWTLLRRLPTAALGALGGTLILLGLRFASLSVETPYLFWLGLIRPDFQSADYFPLLPNLGFFLLGAMLGRTVYRDRRSLLPNADTGNPVLRFLMRCGRHSLPIYLLHQPVLMLAISLFTL